MIILLVVVIILGLLRLGINIILKFSTFCLLKALIFGLSWQIILLKLILNIFISKITNVNIANTFTNILNLNQIILKLVIKIISFYKFCYILISSLTKKSLLSICLFYKIVF